MYCKCALLKGTSTMLQFSFIDAWVCVVLLAVSYMCVADATVLQPFSLFAVSSGATLERHETVSLELCNCKPQRTQGRVPTLRMSLNMLFKPFSVAALLELAWHVCKAAAYLGTVCWRC